MSMTFCTGQYLVIELVFLLIDLYAYVIDLVWAFVCIMFVSYFAAANILAKEIYVKLESLLSTLKGSRVLRREAVDIKTLTQKGLQLITLLM